MNRMEALFAAYAGCGLAFALVFVTAGIARVDHAARGGTWGFRVRRAHYLHREKCR
jgi:hypothetical protein